MRIFNDLKCIALQKMVFKKLNPGQKPNSFDPRNTPGEGRREDGLVLKTDLCYGAKYPNSHFDLWFLEENREKKCPVVIYFHGGGFIFGDKVIGDPLAVGKDGDNAFCAELAKRGYKVVNANYALAPRYRFPIQLEQTGQLLAHLQEHAGEYAIDMDRVFLSGGSAGADIAECYGAVLTCPEYAKAVGCQPAIQAEQVIGLLIDEAALAPSQDKNLNVLTGCMLGVDWKMAPEALKKYDPTRYIQEKYIPSFLNASTEEIAFPDSALALKEVLDRSGTDYDFFMPKPEDGVKKHGYMKDFATDPCSRACLEALLAFMDRQLEKKRGA